LLIKIDRIFWFCWSGILHKLSSVIWFQGPNDSRRPWMKQIKSVEIWTVQTFVVIMTAISPRWNYHLYRLLHSVNMNLPTKFFCVYLLHVLCVTNKNRSWRLSWTIVCRPACTESDTVTYEAKLFGRSYQRSSLSKTQKKWRVVLQTQTITKILLYFWAFDNFPKNVKSLAWRVKCPPNETTTYGMINSVN